MDDFGAPLVCQTFGDNGINNIWSQGFWVRSWLAPEGGDSLPAIERSFGYPAYNRAVGITEMSGYGSNTFAAANPKDSLHTQAGELGIRRICHGLIFAQVVQRY